MNNKDILKALPLSSGIQGCPVSPVLDNRIRQKIRNKKLEELELSSSSMYTLTTKN